MTDDYAAQGAGVTSLVTAGTGFTGSHLVPAPWDQPWLGGHVSLGLVSQGRTPKVREARYRPQEGKHD